MTVQRVILIGCSAVAVALASLTFASPASATGCPSGTVSTRFPGVCVSGTGGFGADPIVVPPPTGAGGSNISNVPGNGFPTVDGIPCTPEHQGTCMGLTQNGG